MSAPNGMQPGGGAPYGLGNAVMPSAGHHHDMQHVWSLVEELSGILQHSREQWDDLQAGMSRAQMHPTNGASAGTAEGEDEGGESAEQAQAETIADLRKKLAEAERQIEDRDVAYRNQAELVTAFENGIHETAQRLRNYVYEQTRATNAMKTRYEEELAISRNETLQAQLTHQAWQTSLARVSEGVRLAYKEKTQQSLPYLKKIAGLKEENRILRLKAGWDPPSDDSDGEWEEGEAR